MHLESSKNQDIRLIRKLVIALPLSQRTENEYVA